MVLSPIVASTYHSIEQAQSALSSLWDVKFTQAKAGDLEIRLQSTKIDRCLLYKSSSNIPLICTGIRTPNVVTISPISSTCERGKYRGRQLQAGQLLVMDPGGDAFQQIAANHQQTAVSIPIDLLDRIARAEYGIDHGSYWNWRVLTPPPHQSDTLRQTLESIVSGASHHYTGANADVRFAEMIFAMVRDRSQERSRPSKQDNRQLIVRKAEEFIRSRLSTPPSILELCEITGAGRRALFYAFDEFLGLSPIAYLKSARLHEARRRMIASDEPHCVQRVARDLNFTHLGQFSIDYLRVFGESPSKTVKRFHGAS